MTVRPLLGAALLALQPATAPASPTPAEVRVDLSSFAIDPKVVHLTAGRPVRLIFVNRSGGGHDFTARGFFAAAREVRGPVRQGTVELGGHLTATVDLVPARGSWKAHCSHFGHKTLGMKAVILAD